MKNRLRIIAAVSLTAMTIGMVRADDSYYFRFRSSVENSQKAALSVVVSGDTSGSPEAAFSAKATALAARETVHFSVTSGGLPPGVGLNSNTGDISGYPSAPGQYVATITATDAFSSASAQLVAVISDNDPDPWNFANLINQNPSALVVSNTARIGGIDIAVPISISGGALRTCADAGCVVVLTDWAVSGSIENNQYLQARQTTPAANNATSTATIVVGARSAPWSATTFVADHTPDAFSFQNLTNQAQSTMVSSNIVRIGGINTATTATASYYSSSVRVCADAACSVVISDWVASTTINDGQYLQARQMTPALPGNGNTAQITVGTVVVNWEVRTTAPPPSGTWVTTGSTCAYSGLPACTATQGACSPIGSTCYNPIVNRCPLGPMTTYPMAAIYQCQ